MLQPAIRQLLKHLYLFVYAFTFLPGLACTKHSEPGGTQSDQRLETNKEIVYENPPVFAGETAAITHDFRVTNDTSDDVVFVDILRSCSCTRADLDDKHLVPNASTILHFDAKLNGKSGLQRFSCRIVDESGNSWTYTIQVMIYESVKFVPARLWLGSVAPGVPHTGEVTLETYAPHGREPGKLERINASAQHILATVRQDSLEVLPDGVKCRRTPLVLELLPHTSPGRCFLEVSVWSDDKQVPAQIEVEWTIKSHYELKPPRLFFHMPKQPQKEPIEKKITISRVGGKLFHVKSVSIDNPALTVDVELNSDRKEHLLVFRADSEKVTGSCAGEITIDTNCPDESSMKLPFALFINGDG